MDMELSSGVIATILFALACLAAAPGLIATLRSAGMSERIGARLRRDRKETSVDGADRATFASWFAKLGAFAARTAPDDEESSNAIRFKLLRARFTHVHAVPLFYLSRLVCLAILQIVLLILLPFIDLDSFPPAFPLLASGLLAAIGLMLPDVIVDRRIARAELECSEGFPDMMDLLVACVEAGLSLDAAVLRVSEELTSRHTELSLNLKTLALEMRAGRSRTAAWRAFADRVGLEEAGSLATMLRQSEEMGTSLGETLRVFSSTMRQRRMLLAEEKAMALPAKMTVPLILFVFPVLLGVLIVPAIIRFQSFM